MVGAGILVLLVAEHFALRAKLAYVAQKYLALVKNKSPNKTSSVHFFLWMTHMLGLAIVFMIIVSAIYGELKNAPQLILGILMGVIVVKDIRLMFSGPFDEAFSKKPKLSEPVADVVLILFALCLHTVWWDIGVAHNGSILYHPYINTPTAVIVTFIMNVVGISFLFLFSYLMGRVPFLLQEKVFAMEKGTAVVVMPYIFAFLSNIISVMLLNS